MTRFATLLLLTAAWRVSGAQVIETPTPFDSTGRVQVMTPALATRIALTPPEWPVTGAFTEARLYTSSAGGGVIVVNRGGGLERHALTEDQLRGLRIRVDAALASDRGFAPTEPAAEAVQQTRGTFVRNHMILATALYGPLLASLSEDGETATALYLVSIGASYFALNNIKRTTIITRAQTDLSTDGALRGAGTASALLLAFGDENINQKTASGTALAGAIIGAITGYQRGIGLTSAEAHAAMSASNFAAATAFGVLGATRDEFANADDERLVAGSMVAAGLAGYVLGPNYPRKARYTVTAGDVRVLLVGATLGAMAGATPFAGNDDNIVFAGATAGGLLGIALVERQWSRPFDHISSDVTQIWLGTVAGALLGTAGVVLSDPSVKGGMLLVTGGGVLGALAGHNFANPARAGSRAMRPEGERRVRFDAAGLVFAASRVPGQHALLRLSF